MYINQVLELFMELDRDRFQKVLNRIYKRRGIWRGTMKNILTSPWRPGE